MKEYTEKQEKARTLFMECGFNCTQAVVGAFAGEMGIDTETALKIASPFGGGVGRLREVCGAVSGMMMVLGALYGYCDPSVKTAKPELYEKVRLLADRFAEENGSIICRELLNLRKGETGGEPAERTPEFYRTRPCVRCIMSAAGIIESFIRECGGDSE